MEFTSGNFFIETIVPENELIVSRTDLKGNVTYANDLFAQISGYTTNQLIGQAHNIVRHPDMPKSVFNEMWESLKSNGKWSGVVKNLRKDFGYYWVYAQISGVYKNDKLVEYKSIRSPITFEEKVKYQKLYDQIRQDNNDLKEELYTNSSQKLHKSIVRLNYEKNFINLIDYIFIIC